MPFCVTFYSRQICAWSHNYHELACPDKHQFIYEDEDFAKKLVERIEDDFKSYQYLYSISAKLQYKECEEKSQRKNPDLEKELQDFRSFLKKIAFKPFKKTEVDLKNFLSSKRVPLFPASPLSYRDKYVVCLNVYREGKPFYREWKDTILVSEKSFHLIKKVEDHCLKIFEKDKLKWKAEFLTYKREMEGHVFDLPEEEENLVWVAKALVWGIFPGRDYDFL